MKLGYARVSTREQELALQLDALNKAGCEQIFEEKLSGATKERPQLQKLLVQLREGDVLVIWKLDRLARSLQDLVTLVEQIREKGAALHSLNDQIDTSTAQGKFTFHLFAALSEFERDIIRERTKAGLIAARARGRQGGRPRGLSKKAQYTAIIAEKLYKEGKLTVKEICEQLSIAKSTLYQYLRHQGLELTKSSSKKKVLKVKLWLRVETNSKYVRGKKKARQEIEAQVLQDFGMEKLRADGFEYQLYIPYASDEELDLLIERDILTAAAMVADIWDCFIEADLEALDGSERVW